VYREQDVFCDKNVSLARNIALGKGTRIGFNVNITQTVIGRMCNIGAKSTISGSIIWDAVSVGEETTITDSLICSGAVIGKNAIIQRGCVIGNGVRIDDFVTIPPFTQIVLPKYKDSPNTDDDGFGSPESQDDSDDADSSKPIVRLNDPSNEGGIVGINGEGVRLEPSSQNPVFNTLVPRDVQAEDSLFLGEEELEDEDDDYNMGRESYRAKLEEDFDEEGSEDESEEEEESSGKSKRVSYLDDEDEEGEGEENDDTIGLLKPVAVKKGFLDSDSEEEEITPKKGSFFDDSDEDDEDSGPKKEKKGFFDDSDEDEEDEDKDFVPPKVQIPTVLDAPSFSTDTKFQIEVAELVSSALSESSTQEKLDRFHMQVRMLRMPYNTTDDAVACAIVRKLLKVAAQPKDQSVLEMKNSIHNVIDKWGESLVQRHVSDGRVLLEYVYTLCHESENPFKERFFPIILHALFQDEILPEKAITDWETDKKSSPSTASDPYFVACADLLNWLHESDSEN